jgi:DNA polymerase I-like protein with 3'-5' exonuclease and polymerase domains
MLIGTVEQLAEVLQPVIDGRVALAAFDTETTEIREERFTPWGTDARIAGFSMSYDDVDFYAPIRHRPYDWRRRRDLVAKDAARDGPAWVRRLEEEEGVGPEGWLPGWDPNLDPAAALALLGLALHSDACTWIAHNWSFDGNMLRADDIEPPWERMEDTQFLSVFTDERPMDKWDDDLVIETEAGTRRGGYLHRGHALKHISELYASMAPDEEDLLKQARKVLQCDDFSMLPLRTIVAPYACGDTRRPLRLLAIMRERGAWKDERIQRRYYQELRLLRHVMDMERRGVLVRPSTATHLASEAERKLEANRNAINEAIGKERVPLDNPKDMAALMYDELALPKWRGNADTRKGTLKRVRERLDPEQTRGIALIDGLLEHRNLTKELTAFYRPLAQFGEDGRVHPIIRQLAAQTGRMSASKPNLQQLKKKGDVRRVFRPADGHEFAFFDYSSIEMRIAAHYTHAIPDAFQRLFTWGCTMAKRGSCKGRPPHGSPDDPGECRRTIHTGWRPQWSMRPEHLHLYEGFLGDKDFDPHARMVDYCQREGIEEIDRDTGKMANFALLYGAGILKLADILDCTEELARRIYNIFWQEAYAELQRVRDFIGERLRQHGKATQWSGQRYITTLKGRRFHLESAHKAMNWLVQGSAREVLGDAIVDVGEYLERETRGEVRSYVLGTFAPCMPVHDELIIEYPRDCRDRGVFREIVRRMVAAGSESTVPMVVEPEISTTSWHKDEREPFPLEEAA